MTKSNKAPKIPIKEFVGTRQTTLFQSLKQPQFTGELIFGSSKGEEWIFYFYLGRILYATGGPHPNRRWIRNVTRFAPDLMDKISSLDQDLIRQKNFRKYWEYELLAYWLKRDEVTRQQLNSIIKNIVIEILFDITQRMEVVFHLKSGQSLSSQLVLIDPDQVIVEAWENWQVWQSAKLADRFPNQCPVIRQPEKLQERTSQRTFHIMSRLFNGKTTLRDLSLQINQDLTQVTRSMLPYVQLGLIDLIDIPDAPCPINFDS